MNAAALHPGAQVEVDIRGRVFTATITGNPAGERWPIKPPRGVGYHSITERQVRRILQTDQLQLGAS
jgi:hypothetical protein